MNSLVYINSTCVGAAVGLVAWWVLGQWRNPAPAPLSSSHFESERRARLEFNPVYRNFPSLVHELASLIKRFLREEKSTEIQHQFRQAATPEPWEPEEYLALKVIEGTAAGLVVGGIMALAMGWIGGAVATLFIAVIYPNVALARLREEGILRLRAVKMRLPYVIDLMALMIEAGANFQDGLKTVVRESRGHPLGEELARVERQIEGGMPRAEAMRSFHDRLTDEDIREMVFSINKGEELGTPLAGILRSQADQLRLKRSQWGEKAAAEAQVKMTFPGLIVTLACMLVVLAPILMPLVSQFLE